MRVAPRFTLASLAGVALALALGRPGAALAEPLPPLTARTWQQVDGLPGDEISALCQDPQGFLWVATWAGLARFDGTRFRRHDPSGPAAPGVAAIAPDPAGGGVWAAPVDGGLRRFRNGSFAPFPLPDSHAMRRIARLLVARDGALWICFEGGEVMRLHGDRHEVFGAEYGLEARRSTQIATDGEGRVWLANGPVLLRYEAGTLARVPVADGDENLRIASAHRDGPWVLTHARLRKLVAGAPPMETKLSPSLDAYSVQALLEDARGTLWIGTRARGVRRLDPAKGTTDAALKEPQDVGVLLEDRSGNVWVGSNGGGLVRLQRGWAQRLGREQGLLDLHTLGVCEDGAGTIWVADREGGVGYLSAEGRVHTLAPPVLRGNFVARSLVPADGAGIRVATTSGLWRATQSGVLTQDGLATPAGHGQLRVMHRSRRGETWVALEPGRLGRLRGTTWREFTTADGLDGGVIQALAEDAAGDLWVGTERSGLYRQAGERFAPAPLAAAMPPGGIQAIHFDATGTGWIGTAAAGLLRLGDPRGRALTEAHGLPTRNLTQIISDDHGALWLGSPEGIFRVRRTELLGWFEGATDRVDAMRIGWDEGLGPVPCPSGHQPSVWKARDGRLWFATRQGIVTLDPGQEPPPPPLAVGVDAVQADGAELAVAQAAVIPPLVHAVEFTYSVLCLDAPARVRARIRLRGYDDDWVPADPRGVARYTRLPPGRYVFEVAARLAGAPGSEISRELPVAVTAAWWQTAWFRGGAGLVLLVAAAALARVWVQRRLRAQREELERATALERERARIARNIHDDLGSGLTRVSLLTQTADPGDGRAQLDRIYHMVGDLTQSMDEIVWAVNPKNDHLEGFANYLVEYAQGFLTDAGLRCRVELPDTLPACSLQAQFRHHLFLGCKEALNNVAKHSHATEVTLQLRIHGDRIVLVVADNGRGFTPPAGAPAAARPGGREGLGNMCSRLEALGGTCEIVSALDGTTVTFSAPLPPADSPA